MRVFNIDDAKAQFSRLVERAAAGEEIVIGKAGKPIARLVSYKEPPTPKRKPGSMRGKIKIKPGFDAVDERIGAAFRGEIEE